MIPQMALMALAMAAQKMQQGNQQQTAENQQLGASSAANAPMGRGMMNKVNMPGSDMFNSGAAKAFANSRDTSHDMLGLLLNNKNSPSGAPLAPSNSGTNLGGY